jgi:hypothetical protein
MTDHEDHVQSSQPMGPIDHQLLASAAYMMKAAMNGRTPGSAFTWEGGMHEALEAIKRELGGYGLSGVGPGLLPRTALANALIMAWLDDCIRIGEERSRKDP